MQHKVLCIFPDIILVHTKIINNIGIQNATIVFTYISRAVCINVFMRQQLRTNYHYFWSTKDDKTKYSQSDRFQEFGIQK